MLLATSLRARLEQVKQLHTILLVVGVVCIVLFLVALMRPYQKQLQRDSRAVVGLLSQLPAEVDMEGHVKTMLMKGHEA